MNGVEGYVSICGHSNPKCTDIWRNSKGNVIIATVDVDVGVVG